MSTASTNPNQALLEKGDFTRIAATMRESGKGLVHRLGIEQGMKVLDLGCGDFKCCIEAESKALVEKGAVAASPQCYRPRPHRCPSQSA